MPAQWYFSEEGQQRGPVSFEQLQDLAKSGQLKPTDLVWAAHMADWAPASSQPGLFGTVVPVAPAPQPRRERAYDRPPDDYDRPVRRTGMGTGAKIALFGCGGVTVLMLMCCGILGVIGIINKTSNELTWDLPTGGTQHWTLPFKQGDKVQLIVESDGDSDMDLFVFQNKANFDTFLRAGNLEKVAGGLCIAFDNSPSSNCRVEFTAPVTGNYWVLVANRKLMDQPQRNGRNNGTLVYYPAQK